MANNNRFFADLQKDIDRYTKEMVQMQEEYGPTLDYLYNVDEFLEEIEDSYTELLCKKPKELDYSLYEHLYDCEWEHHPARISWISKMREWLIDKKRYEEVLTHFHCTTLIEFFRYLEAQAQ